jgi:hypothetical protein
MMIVYHTLLPSFLMAPCTSDRFHTWALAELDLPQKRVWYFSLEDYYQQQQFVTQDVSMLMNRVGILMC